VDKAFDEVMKAAAFSEQSGGGLTLSSGEPLPSWTSRWIFWSW
jgi:pyruvate-formate lyase-activating enzyme